MAATARQKCLDVYQAALEEHKKASTAKPPPEDPALVIAADTVIVTRAGQVLEKPRSEADHIRMLKHLRDTRVHRVLTAICVLAPKDDAGTGIRDRGTHRGNARVLCPGERRPAGRGDRELRSDEEGVDKAGGYAIQELEARYW